MSNDRQDNHSNFNVRSSDPLYLVAGGVVGGMAAWFYTFSFFVTACGIIGGAACGRPVGDQIGWKGWTICLGAVAGATIGDVAPWFLIGPLIGACLGMGAAFLITLRGLNTDNRLSAMTAVVMGELLLAAACWWLWQLRVDTYTDCVVEYPKLDVKFSEGGVGGPVITVREKLIELRATCFGGTFYDRWGREICFSRIPNFGTYRKGEENRVTTVPKRHDCIVVKMYATHPAV